MLVGFSACAASLDSPQVLETIVDRVESARRKEKVPGAALALVEGDRLLLARGFGYADARRKTPMQADTRFNLGGFTKLLTAIAVMQQVEQGRYRLDTPITQALPGLSIENRYDPSSVPTVEQLLSHHGGLPNAILANNYVADPQADLTPLPNLYVSQPVGQIYAYSNLGYLLLGHLLEAHDPRPYRDIVRQSVLAPLGITRVDFAPAEADSRGHGRRGKVRPDIFPRDQSALGAMGSVQDLATLASWSLREDPGPVLSADSAARMQSVRNEDVPLDLDNKSGLAWQLTNLGRFNVDRVLRLNMVTMQFRGLVLLVPEYKLGVVILANSSNSLDFVLEQGRQAMDDLLRAKAGILPPDREQKLPGRVELPGGAVTGLMSSRYSTPLGIMEMTARKDQFDARYLGRKFRLRPRADGWFDIAYRLFGLINLRFNIIKEVLFRPVQLDGQHVLLLHYQGQDFLFGTELNGTTPQNAADLAARSGVYLLENPDAFSERLELKSVELSHEDGVLYALYRLPMFLTLKPKIPLLPQDRHRYYIPGLGTALGERVVFNEQGGFEFSGYEFRRKQ